MKLSPSIQQRLLAQHFHLDDFLIPLEQDHIYQRWIPGKWSIHEQVAHLGRYQEILRERLNSIVQGSKPVFERYRAENDPVFPSWFELDTVTIGRRLKKDREDIINWVKQLDDVQGSMKGKHPVLGWMHVSEWIQFFILHEAHHLYAIFWLIHGYVKGKED